MTTNEQSPSHSPVVSPHTILDDIALPLIQKADPARLERACS